MQDRIFYSICLGFTLGVLLRSFFVVNIFSIIFLAFISLSLFLFFILISKSRLGTIATIFLVSFSFGILIFHSADQPALTIFESQLGSRAFFSGVIVDEPDQREKNQKLTIRLTGQETKILVTTSLGEEYKYGDEVGILGKLEKPENFITDQGKEFDYINYLRKDGIFYVISYPDIRVVSSGNGNGIKALLFSIKNKFLEKMNYGISPPENLLMGGLILGERSAFNQDLRQSLVDTGTIHIVALSGYNVTIIAEWIMKAFSFLPKNLGIGAGILAIFIFVLMTGGSSTAIRAGIMAILVLLARATGRNYDVARALILAGVFMILINPFILVYDVSFQLSFIATVAVIFFTPRIEKYFMWITKRFGLRDVVSITCAAYIFVLPFILYKMGNLSLVALPANILILPFIPLTMMFGFLTGFFGLIFNVLALPFGYISYALLHYELGIISFFASLPFAAFTIPNFPLMLTLSIYAYFIYMLFGRSIKTFFQSELNK